MRFNSCPRYLACIAPATPRPQLQTHETPPVALHWRISPLPSPTSLRPTPRRRGLRLQRLCRPGRVPTREPAPLLQRLPHPRPRRPAHASAPAKLLIENLTPSSQPSDALLHHWRATAFVPNATPADFERLLRDFSAYPHNFAPEILASTVLTQTPTHTLLRLRTRQHHVITVVLDTTCDVTFATLDPAHGYSISRSTRIDEITPTGAAATDEQDNGFLYRLNTYWSYEQQGNGLYLQLECLSLTRAIPHGLAWAVRPYLESIPRDSLVFTLTSARNALHKPAPPQLKTSN